MNTRVIAIANIKGGVGKTTTTANLGAALVERGRRVLAIALLVLIVSLVVILQRVLF